VLLEDGQLSVVDLSSTNGTYVIDRGGVPTEDAVPLAAGVPAVLDDGDQIFVGAWSRLTVRRT
jgi:pSer/pThr/pTyr-binding forkhead associated (FHA) protein